MTTRSIIIHRGKYICRIVVKEKVANNPYFRGQTAISRIERLRTKSHDKEHFEEHYK